MVKVTLRVIGGDIYTYWFDTWEEAMVKVTHFNHKEIKSLSVVKVKR